jgi:hypothetical protein
MREAFRVSIFANYSGYGQGAHFFLGVANLALLTDNAPHMRALALLIQGVAHGLAVDRQLNGFNLRN